MGERGEIKARYKCFKSSCHAAKPVFRLKRGLAIPTILAKIIVDSARAFKFARVVLQINLKILLSPHSTVINVEYHNNCMQC